MAVQLAPLGRTLVGTPGTPVAVSVPATLQPPAAHACVFQALPTNSGKVYIGTQGMNKTTLVGVLVVLAIPSDNQIPAFSLAVTHAANAIPLADLRVDADVAGEGVLISALVV